MTGPVMFYGHDSCYSQAKMQRVWLATLLYQQLNRQTCSVILKRSFLFHPQVQENLMQAASLRLPVSSHTRSRAQRKREVKGVVGEVTALMALNKVIHQVGNTATHKLATLLDAPLALIFPSERGGWLSTKCCSRWVCYL
eukprot:GHUV01031479.1.p1 GENE.GHUV01031479.1~~GHUV01031479.1.p1  ORF type:complete len:140 (-),score=15.50 GHUV01031479.1:1285-1704(-)